MGVTEPGEVLARRARLAEEAARLTRRAELCIDYSEGMRTALRDWQSHSSGLLNDALRDVPAEPRAGGLFDPFADVPVAERRAYLRWLYDELTSAAVLAFGRQVLEAPKKIYRGIRHADRFVAELNRHGSVLVFESWTLDPYVAYMFTKWADETESAILEAELLPGFPMIWMPLIGGDLSDQHEVLLPPGRRAVRREDPADLPAAAPHRQRSMDIDLTLSGDASEDPIVEVVSASAREPSRTLSRMLVDLAPWGEPWRREDGL